MKKLMLLGLILLVVLIAGCAGTSPTEIAKGTQMAQSFLNEYPNANIVAAYFNETSMQSLLPDLQQKCGTQITSSDYYKVSITDVSKNLDVVVWVDAKSQTPVCAIRTAPNSTVIQPNPGPSKPPISENGLPDLIVSDMYVQPESPIVGQQIAISLTLKNIGTATAYPVIYILSVNGSATRSNENEPLLSLSPGGTMTYKITSDVVTKYNIGSYDIKVEVNPVGVNGPRLVKESNYDNNIAEKAISVTGNIQNISTQPTANGFGQLHVLSQSLSSDGNLSLNIENAVGGPIIITGLESSIEGVKTACDVNPDVSIDAGAQALVTCNMVGWSQKSSGQTYSATLDIQFTYQNSEFTSSGIISGTY